MLLWITIGILLAAPLQSSGLEDKKCCMNGDCYDSSPPFDSILIPLPACAEEIQPVYHLYTRTNRNTPQPLDRNTVPSAFDGSRMTIIIIHGYRNDITSSWVAATKDALLDRDNVNVVVVGWGKGADIINYFKAVSNTRVMGNELSYIMTNLVSNGGTNYNRMWCVGFSLGAHICGRIGKKTKYGRITGLDPAGPAWDDLDISAGLVKSDANYVQAIHTHGRELIPWGSLKPRAHTDFYPNAARIQPGCMTYDLTPKTALLTKHLSSKIEMKDADKYGMLSCSHSRAYELFIESIKQPCFMARYKCTKPETIPADCVLCTNCPLMGYDGTPDHDGLFYIRTSGAPPFCI